MDATHAAEDNRKNTRDELVKNTLDSVMASQEQSYEEFVKGFTFFKTDSEEKKVKKPDSKDSVKSNSENKECKQHSRRAIPSGPDITSQKKVTIPYTDCIEEEILPEGSSGSRLNASKSIKTGTSVKFDNFISSNDDDDDDDSADIPIDIDTDVDQGGYSASFLGPASSTRLTGPMSVKQQRQEPSQTNVSKKQKRQEPAKVAVYESELIREPVQSPDVTELFNGLSVEESHTDKLLMNFLADLQNEMNENPQVRSEPARGSGDIQAFLDRRTQEQMSEVNFSDDESEDVLALCTDSTENNLKIVVDSNEIRPAGGEHSGTKGEVSQVVLTDSEGNTTVSVSEVNIESAIARNHQEMDPAKVVFPGEVENAEKELGAGVKETNERLLDFKAVYAPHTSQLADAQTTGRTVNTTAGATTLIERFQLDDAFDYDHVVLAPKFSMLEMDQIRGRQIEQPAKV